MKETTDLRIVKTERLIKEAFLELRRSMPLEKIKVRDLCRKACINTSTFYHHYEDIFALSDSLENEVLKEAFDTIEGKDQLFKNPAVFLAEAPKRMEENNRLISVLFKDREEIKFSKLLRQLQEYYKTQEMSEDLDIAFTFAITGCMHTMYLFLSEGKYDSKQLEKECSSCIEKILNQSDNDR